MISSVIENEIITKLPFLINSFGSVNKILTYLKEVNSVSLGIPKKDLLNFSYINLINHIKLILEYKERILIVSPWSLKYDLTEINPNKELDVQIDFTQPYKVYDLDHNLLYTCTDHKGTYGLSILDKWLVQKSKNMSTYYLEYKDISGEVFTQLLIINLSSEKTLDSNIYFKPPEEALESKLITIANDSGENVVFYYLVEEPKINYSINNIRINGEEITVTPNNQFIINSNQKPFWILLKESRQVVYNSILPPENEIFIPVIYNSLYYVAVNANPELVNKIFNTNLTDTTKTFDQQLRIIYNG